MELWAGKLIECSRLHELIVQDNWRETQTVKAWLVKFQSNSDSTREGGKEGRRG